LEADQQCDEKLKQPGGAFFVDLHDIIRKLGMKDDEGHFSSGGGTVVQWIQRCTAIVDLSQWNEK
jgi:hypothetical protein